MAKFNFSKYNRAGQEYKTLEGLFNEDSNLIHPIRSIYINNKSKFGDAPVIVSDGYNINLPKHMTATVQEMLQDPEAMALIRAGKVGISVYEYTNEEEFPGETFYGATFEEI